jgi:Na+/phosphate symporter
MTLKLCVTLALIVATLLLGFCLADTWEKAAEVFFGAGTLLVGLGFLMRI